MSSTDATPVLGSGTQNLDSGSSLEDQLSSFTEFFEEEEQSDEDVVEVGNEELEDELEDEEVVEEEDEEEASESEAEDSEDFYVVEIGDEQFEVTESELLSGYQRQKDYTRKTQEVSDERKELDALKEQLSTERDGYITQMEQVAKTESDAVKARYAGIDWAQLRKDDPTQYMLLREDLQADEAKVESALNKRKLAVEARASELDKQQTQRTESELKRVEEFIPDFNDDARSKLNAQVEAEGFTDADKALLNNAQVIKLLDKARKYDELQERRDTVVKKKVAKKVPKLIKPGNGTATSQQVTKEAKAKRKASLRRLQNNTSSRQDSVDVFSQFL